MSNCIIGDVAIFFVPYDMFLKVNHMEQQSGRFLNFMAS